MTTRAEFPVSGDYMKEPATSAPASDHDHHEPTKALILGEKSPGVARIEAISSQTTFWNKVAIYCSVFLIAYVYSLDGTLRFSLQVRS
jgi:SIT family siderophore-iron:H+ symporter-like MFS transporter